MTRIAPIAKRFVVAVILLTLVTGCGDGATGDGFTGERGQVSGTVTLDGQPLQTGCQVIFIAEKSGYTASGVIGEGGKYSLVYSDAKGLPVGNYLVQLTAPVIADSTTVVDPTQMGNQMKLGSIKKPGESNISGPFPTKYGSTNTSKLTFNVGAKPNTADFKLTK